jgi:hypothetical protein
VFDNYLYIENSTRNVVKNGTVEGFELSTYITYYRGIPLSMIHQIKVTVDQVDVEPADILFSPDKVNYYTLAEMETCATVRWEYGDPGVIYVRRPGGLSKGKHDVTLSLAIRVAYIPVPFGATKTQQIEIH